MVVPLYIAENAPRAIRGGLTGIYQLFIACGTMLAFWVNYGSILHLKGEASYMVPLAMQMLPAVALVVCMLLNRESPRWLAKADRWEDATAVLARMRNLPAEHPYVRAELKDISDQLEHERMLIGGATLKDLLREMFTIPGNRKRALISIGLMICQQMTGKKTTLVRRHTQVNARQVQTPSTTTPPKSSKTSASSALPPASSQPASTAS